MTPRAREAMTPRAREGEAPAEPEWRGSTDFLTARQSLALPATVIAALTITQRVFESSAGPD
jgi:hypothetical protein